MKRHSNVIGTLSPHYGLVPITHPAVAQALRDADHEIAELRRRLATAHDAGEKQQRIINERNLSLASIQNHWWTRLGEALGIVGEVRHATQGSKPATSPPAADRQAPAASPQAGLQQQTQPAAAAR